MIYFLNVEIICDGLKSYCLVADQDCNKAYAEWGFSFQILTWLNNTKTEDSTIPWQWINEGPKHVLFNSHTSTDYVLEGAELTASSDSWAGSCTSLGRTARLLSDTLLGLGLVSAPLVLHPHIVACHLHPSSRGIGRPLHPLDEHPLKAVFESWWALLRRSVFYFPPACLGLAFIRLPGFAILPTWWSAMGLKRLSFVLFSKIKLDDLPKKILLIIIWKHMESMPQ